MPFPNLRTYETVLYATDLEAVRRFYESVVGLRFLSLDTHRGIGFRVDDRSVLLIFNPQETVKPHDVVPSHGARGEGHIAFAVGEGELPAWRGRLAGAGVEIEREVEWPTGAKSIYVRDPAGNSVEFAEGEIWPR